MNIIQLTGALEIGLIYAFVAFGVYLTFKVINFPDLTVDGSFPLGAAVTAVCAVSGYGVGLSLIFSFFAGAFAGLLTGLLNVKGKIMDLLSGILTMSALYSINLRIMGQPNIALDMENNIFDSHYLLYVLLVIAILFNMALVWFMKTEIGLAIRATGINEKSAQSSGVNIGLMKLLTLSLSNALVAVGGAIFALSQGFADISMGTGTIIIGLASVIIGEKLLRSKTIMVAIFGCIVGSVIYRICIALALNAEFLSLNASDVNIITSTIVALALIVPKFGRRISFK